MEMQRKYKNEESDNINLIESWINRIDFNNESREVHFEFEWTEGDSLTCVCNIFSNFEMRTSYSPYGSLGALEISGFSYLKRNNGYIIQFNFDYPPSIGYIKLYCKDFYFITSSPPIQKGGNDNRIDNGSEQ